MATRKIQDNIIIREASENDFQSIAELLSRNNYGVEELNWSPSQYVEWLRWKYLENPDGHGRVFVAEDVSTRAIVGMNPFIPRWFTSKATGDFPAYHGVDAFVAPEMRGRNIYKRIYLFAMSTLNSPKVAFPSRVAMRVSLREGVKLVSAFEKWSFPLSVGKSAAGISLAIVTPILNAVLNLYAEIWLGRRPADVHMKPVAAFERDYALDSTRIHGIRTAAFLNWRFINNPMYAYSTYEFLEDGGSIGYCVYRMRRSTVEIYDFVAGRRQKECLRLLADNCRREGATRLHFRGVGLRMRRFGFIRSLDRNANLTVFRLPEDNWMMTLCDRDY